MLWSCLSDGTILAWDCSSGRADYSFACSPLKSRIRDDADGLYCGPFSLTTTRAGDVLAVGVAHEIQFWDVRELLPPRQNPAALPVARLMGAYTDSHAHTPPSYGSVRHLAMHPIVPHTLVSGGDDGMINVFDLSIRGEDDALVSALNVGSAVAGFGFFGDQAALLWAVTEFGGMSLWNFSSAQRLSEAPLLRMQFMEAGLDQCQVCIHPREWCMRLGCLARPNHSRPATFRSTSDLLVRAANCTVRSTLLLIIRL